MDHRAAPPELRTARGRAAEELAARYLAAQGFDVIERNIRLARGELDLIAWEGAEIVFVEVRSRRGGSPYGPRYLSSTKRRRLIRAASAWLGRHRLGNALCRFDLVTVRFTPSGARLDHHRGAFVDDFED